MNVNMKPLRQRAGAPGGQHGDQQGPHRQDHQRPRRCRPTSRCRRRCRATTRTTRATPTTSDKAKALLAEAGHRRRLRHRSLRPSTPIPTRASPRRSSRIWRRSASRPASSRSTRPTSSPPAASKAGAPMIWSGGMALDRRLPRSVRTSTGRSSAAPARCQGGWNWSWYCNKDLDAEAAKADCDGRSGQGRRRAPSCGARSSPRSWTTRPGRRSSTSSASPCTRARMGGADDALRRPGPHPDQLRQRLRNRCAVDCDHTIHGAPSSFRLGQFVPTRAERVAPGDDDRVRVPRFRRAASFTPTAPSPTSPRSTSPRSIRSPARSSSTAPSRATRSR